MYLYKNIGRDYVNHKFGMVVFKKLKINNGEKFILKCDSIHFKYFYIII